MTTMPPLSAGASFALGAMTSSAFLQGVSVGLAAGLSGQFFRPLGAGPYAFAKLGNAFNVAVGQLAEAAVLQAMLSGGFQIPQPQAQWTATLGQNGQGKIDLGDGYTLNLNEHNSEVTITNANTGETTRIWGDPHVDVDGKHAFDFWGTTTFSLENGTKITINTEQWGGNPNAYVASQLVITRGDQAITVNGISQNQIGDLSITQGNNGRQLDAAHRDGFVLNENASGSGWRSSYTGQVATQADLNATRVGGEFGPGSQAMSLDELGGALTGFLTLGVMLSLGVFGGDVGASSASDAKDARADAKILARALVRMATN